MRAPLPLMAAAALALATSARAQSVGAVQFVNGIAIAGDTPDLSAGSTFDRRVGFFSDLYYDALRGDYWGLSDRGPGGGVLPYDTRAQRFRIDVDPVTGAIGNFQVLETIAFRDGALPLNGLAPDPTNVLGVAFDPEGFVVHPTTGRFFVSDEYGPSLIEFDRSGHLVRRFEIPANILPRNAGSGAPNHASDAGNDAGKRTNRGFEGLAVTADGRFVYATLQSAMLDEGGGDGVYVRIVKYDTQTGLAVGQYLYRMEGSSQGRGLSALVALGDDRLLALERNNRGVGVGADFATANKSVYEIDLTGATDVSALSVLPGNTLPGGVTPVTKIAKVMDLDANTLAALGNKSPEKWEGLAIGPQLAGGEYLILAGTDNDYSVTQNGTGTQFDVYFRFSDADPYASSIQCPLGQTTGCVFTAGGAPATVTGDYALLPGVLHAYTANIAGYLAPFVTPEPATVALTGLGLLALGASGARRMRR
jgi:hypothetical protein